MNIKNLWQKFKEFNNTSYGTLITVSWVVLTTCLIIKLFGGNWFELWWENEKFISFCNYVEDTQWLKMTIACCIYLFTTYPVLCIVLNKQNIGWKLNLLFLPLMIVKSILGWYWIWTSYVLDTLIIIILPIILTKNWKKPILGNILVVLFQIITVLIRNMSMDFNVGNTVIENYLYQIDYYIMIVLFYLYNFRIKNLKEKEAN